MKIMTDREIIIKLGDTRKVADHFRVPLARVSKWKERGIPWQLRIQFVHLAKYRGLELPASFLLERKAA